MDFLGLGEILLIALVILLVWGPDKLPEFMRTLGRVMGYLRKASSDLSAQVRIELDEEKETGKQEKAEPSPEPSKPDTPEPETTGQKTSTEEDV